MTTFELFPLTDCGPMESPSMSSAEGSPARTSALPEKGQGWRANAPAYGASTPELLASFDPVSSSWKTSQLCFLEGLTTYSGTWPRSGMTRNGIAYQLPPLVPLTGATGSGLWQTPVSDDAVNRKNGKWNSRGEPKLSAQVMWPTPRAIDGRSAGPGTSDGAILRRGGSMNLPERVQAVARQLWPTPTAHNAKECAAPSEYTRNTPTLAAQAGGKLNPTWVEWLMGFPLGWTDCEP